MKGPQALLYDDRLDFINEGATELEGDDMTLLQRVMEQQRRPARPVTFEELAKGLAEVQARTDELLRIDPHEEPAYHAAAMKYMREHPGMSYAAAAEEVFDPAADLRAKSVLPFGRHCFPGLHDRATKLVGENPNMTYTFAVQHEAAMQLMKDNPGMSYDEAFRRVQSGD
jgi:hypothetical protein